MLERTHEHLIEAKRVGAVFGNDAVGSDDIAPALGHFLAVGAEDHALVDQTLEGFGRGDMAEVMENLVPEAGIKKMEHRMLGAADIEVHSAGLATARHPILISLLADEAVGICGITETQIIPA